MALLELLSLLSLGLVGLALALTAWVVRQATHPPHGVFDAPRLGDGLVREPVTLTSRDGTRLAAWFIAGARPQTLLVLHGYTACKDDMLSHAAFLHAAGYSLLLLDLRACGASGGRAVTLGGREQEDVAAALAYLQTRPDVDASQLGILGLSLGGALAILAAAACPAVRAVVAEAPFRSLSSAVRQNFRRYTRLPSVPLALLALRLTEWRHQVRAGAVVPEQAVARLGRCALLLIHAEDDPVIAIADSEAIVHQARGPVEFWRLPSAPHAMAYNVFREAYPARVVAFFDTWLGSPTPPAPVAVARPHR